VAQDIYFFEDSHKRHLPAFTATFTWQEVPAVAVLPYFYAIFCVYP